MPRKTRSRGSGDGNRSFPHFSAKAPARCAWSTWVTNHHPVSVSKRSMAQSLLFFRHSARRFMPVVQEIPLQEHDRKEEGKTQHGGGENQCNKIIRLQLGAGVHDRVAQASLAHPTGPGLAFACKRTNDRNARSNADTDQV